MLHKMLLSNIRDDISGRIREGNEYVRVANHIPPPPKELNSLLSSMLQVYNSNVYDSFMEKGVWKIGV